MRMKRYIILLAVTVLSGLWWSCASYYGIAINIAIRPVALALLVFFLWPDMRTMRKCIPLIVSLFIANVLSNVVYGFQTEWWYITGDGETQLWIAFSFAIQTVVSLVTLFVMDFTLRRMLNKALQSDAEYRAPER